MRKIKLNDITLRDYVANHGNTLSFKEVVEIAKTLDKLRIDTIGLPTIENVKVGSLLIHTITAAVSYSTVSMPTGTTDESLKLAWDAVCGAKHPRLYLELPVSTVQMEFMSHKRPDKLLEIITDIIGKARTLCNDVEFSALDATRADFDFIVSAIKKAIEAGANTVTICDTAGNMFPQEFKAFIEKLYEAVPELKNVCLAVRCADTLSMAAANVFAAFECGAEEACVLANAGPSPSAEEVVKILTVRSELCGLSSGVKTTELNRGMQQIAWIARSKKTKEETMFNIGNAAGQGEILLHAGDDLPTVAKAVKKLGYELSDEDIAKVFESFNAAASKKSVGTKELEAIIASSAMQVPPVYKLKNYVVNCGNCISASAVVHMLRDGKELQGMAVGDGPIDAAILAIEQITGHHYEVDDFQIQAVTEGREAFGSTLIKLRYEGRLYSGTGISTDILGASLGSYMNALNKIAFEEAHN